MPRKNVVKAVSKTAISRYPPEKSMTMCDSLMAIPVLMTIPMMKPMTRKIVKRMMKKNPMMMKDST